MNDTLPNCDPLPIPSYADVRDDMLCIEAFLLGLGEDDERYPIAARVLTPQLDGEPSRLERLAKVAYDYAYQCGDAASTEIHEFADAMVALIYDLPEGGADRGPLRFDKPGLFATTLEVADARRRLEDRSVSLVPSRQLARLARVDEATMEALLMAEDNPAQPYGMSVAEYASMDHGDRNYLYGQNWVCGLGDLQEWLGRLPGFIPSRATMAAN